jgi:hypothetical protein
MPRKKTTTKTSPEPEVKEPQPEPQPEPEPVVAEKKKKRSPNVWVEHCQKVHAKDKTKTFKEVLKTAKETYKKD